MDIQAGLIRVSALATQIRVTTEVTRAGGTVAQIRILATTAISALTAAINAPAIELGVQAQLIKAVALTGQFLKIINASDHFVASDQAAFSLARAFDDLIDIGDEMAMRYGKATADSFAVTDAQLAKVIKGLSDTLGLTDSHVVVMGKVIEEPFTVSDPIAKVLITSRSDAFGVADGPGVDDYAIDYFLEDYTNDSKPLIRFIKGVADAGAITDASTRLTNKGLTEAPALTDALSRHISRQITDNVQATDDFFGEASLDDDEVMAFYKGVSDAFVVGDTFASVVFYVREFNDSAALIDAKTAYIGKALADIPELSDAAAISTAKPLADAATVADAPAKSVAKAFADNSNLTDVTVKSAGKSLSDAGALTDAAAHWYAKALADAGAVTDQESFLLSRSVSDAAGITDAPTKSASKTTTDSAALADSGSIRMQSYCDITYFADDYVGVYTTF